MLRGSLVAGSGFAAGAATYFAQTPDVPWWGHLLMVLVSAALAFFGGRVRE